MSADGFGVDYNKLSSLADTMTGVSGQLRSPDDAIAPIRATVHHDGLKHQLDQFTKNWSEKRDDICNELDQLSTFLQDAATKYSTIDTGLAASFTPDSSKP